MLPRVFGQKMKILHIVNSLSTGGAEKLVADLAPLQRDCGNEVEVLLLKGGESIFREALSAAGIRVHDFGAGTSVYSPLNIFRLIPFMRKYDVVHVHLFPAQYWAVFAKLISFAGTPLVTTEHSTHNRRREIRAFRLIDKFVYGRYAKIVCCSTRAEDALKKHAGNMKNIVCVSNGISTDEFASAEPMSRRVLGIPESAFVLIQVARFNYPKNQDCVIRALKKLPENMHAIFVGDGVRREPCEALAAELGVRERAHFLGVRADVPALLKAADVVVCSSSYEGLSLASAEALASNRPVVASDVPGLAEVVGGAGILFPQGDESALAGTIMRLATDKDFYAQISEQCKKRACDFDIKTMAEKYLMLYPPPPLR